MCQDQIKELREYITPNPETSTVMIYTFKQFQA